MTRDDFINDVSTFDELMSFCQEADLGFCDEFYSPGNYNDKVEVMIEEWMEEYTWRELRDVLESLPTGYDVYVEDGWASFIGYDSTDERFYEVKDEVLEWCDDNDFWDVEDEEENDVFDFDIATNHEDGSVEDSQQEEDDDFGAEEGCSMADLFSAGSECVQIIKAKEEEITKEEILFAAV